MDETRAANWSVAAEIDRRLKNPITPADQHLTGVWPTSPGRPSVRSLLMGDPIRPATVDDAPGLAHVSVASWQAACRGLPPDTLLDGLSVTQRSQRWATNLANPRPRAETLVAVQGANVVGFASIGQRRSKEPQHDDGELYAIYLHRQHWSRGVGSQLHHASMTRMHALGFTSATLWVLIGNERAINFYRRAGWRENGVTRVGTRPDGTELPELQLLRTLPLVP